MEITKSSRHQKIIGDYGEALLCNWLSRSGFEVTIVDHTGIDLVAYNPITEQRLGISVKSRTRIKGKETDSVNLFSNHKNKNDRQKVLDACHAFACEPWIAIYVESHDHADLFLLSLAHYDAHYRGSKKRVVDVWKMGDKYRKQHEHDMKLKRIHMCFNESVWEWE